MSVMRHKRSIADGHKHDIQHAVAYPLFRRQAETFPTHLQR